MPGPVARGASAPPPGLRRRQCPGRGSPVRRSGRRGGRRGLQVPGRQRPLAVHRPPAAGFRPARRESIRRRLARRQARGHRDPGRGRGCHRGGYRPGPGHRGGHRRGADRAPGSGPGRRAPGQVPAQLAGSGVQPGGGQGRDRHRQWVWLLRHRRRPAADQSPCGAPAGGLGQEARGGTREGQGRAGSGRAPACDPPRPVCQQGGLRQGQEPAPSGVPCVPQGQAGTRHAAQPGGHQELLPHPTQGRDQADGGPGGHQRQPGPWPCCSSRAIAPPSSPRSASVP